MKYNYECPMCAGEIEIKHPMRSKQKFYCMCGEQLRKKIGNKFNFILKTKGFYATDK